MLYSNVGIYFGTQPVVALYFNSEVFILPALRREHIFEKKHTRNSKPCKNMSGMCLNVYMVYGASNLHVQKV